MSISCIDMLPWEHVLSVLFVFLCTGSAYLIRRDPELEGGYLEGDMILNPVQNFIIENPFIRNGIFDANFRWQQGIVYYKISNYFDASHTAYIRRAMTSIEEHTCIRFRLANSLTRAYLNIIGDDNSCYSYVGYQGVVQNLNLQLFPVGSGCFRLGSIIHELLHTLGFHHQQSAAERDQYIDIIADNIQSGTEHNFRKYSDSVVTNFGIPYDYDSVMHYPATAFSKNGRDTIVPKDKTAKIGQRTGMSNRDIQKINLMYNCVEKI